MIGVEPGSRCWCASRLAEFGRCRDVGKAAGRIAPKEGEAARTKDQDIGMSVVVVVASQRSGCFVRRRRCRASPRSRRRSRPSVFLQRRRPVRAAVREIEIAIAVEIERRDTARSERRCVAAAAADWTVAVASVNDTSGTLRVDERCLGSCRGDGLGVAALLEVGLGVGDRVAALAAVAGSCAIAARPSSPRPPRIKRVGQAIGSRCVERRCLHRAPKRVDGLRKPALLPIELAQVDGGAGVARIHALHARERLERLLGSPGATGDEADQVVRLRPIRQVGPGRFDFAPGRLWVASIEEGDAEVQAGNRQPRIDLERAAKGRRRRPKVELFEPRHADVVGAVGVFAGRDGARRRGLRRRSRDERDAAAQTTSTDVRIVRRAVTVP